MVIRTFQAGDDVAQVSIYNEAGAELPKFKPATIDEVRRRARASDFDPTARYYAISDNRPVGYITFQNNGRVSYPWCRKGHEKQALPLMEHALTAMRQRGLGRIFAAYRGDWPVQRDFFLGQGFQQTREMINYVMDMVDMPTPAARLSSLISPLTPTDLPAVAQLGKGIFSVPESKLEEHLFRNPYFSASSLFALRSKSDDNPVAIGIVVTNDTFADPKQLDSNMPCFRLGAFGTEGMTTKRINGLFSYLTADTRDAHLFGLDLISYATNVVSDTDIGTFAVQVPSDAAHLARFYKSLFRKQGSFPIYEREL